MNKQEASLLLMKKVMVPRKKHIPKDHVTLRYVSTFNSNLMSLGFTLSLDVINACVVNLSQQEFVIWASEIQELLIKYNGSRTNMKPMYPDFPKQVMEASEADLYCNALLHYMSNGKWTPQYEEKIKLCSESILQPKIIDLTNDKELVSYVKMLAESPVAMSLQQNAIFSFLINEYKNEIYSDLYSIPNKENLAFIIYEISKLKFDFINTLHKTLAFKNINNITDILRIAIEFSGGDSSLSEKCSLRSIKRKDRRFLLSLINEYCSTNFKQALEDAARHQDTWKVVLKLLHPGDYSTKYVYASQFATKVREDKLRTWYSKLEKAYSDNNLNKVVSMLEKRPGEFARRLERTIRMAIKLSEEPGNNHMDAMSVATKFSKVANKVDRVILLQLYAYFKKQFDISKNKKEANYRTFFPKGQMSKVYVTEDNRESIPSVMYLRCVTVLIKTLKDIYSMRDDLGSVYIDPKLKGYTVPLKLRNASSQLHTISRGSRMELPKETNVIRLYTWWKNIDRLRIDVDLSATFYNEEFDRTAYPVSYMNLRIDGCCHSGDIVSAPKGAAEFIDVDINKLLDKDIRYVVMHLNNFTGAYYSEMPECFAGAMVLNEIHENEKVFDPAKSIFRSDISTESTACIPVVFDLKAREIIWVDSVVPIHHSAPNNVEHCKCSTANLVRGILTASYPTLYDLISFNVIARNGIITSKKDAEIIFSLDEGITPYDLEIINKEWV